MVDVVGLSDPGTVTSGASADGPVDDEANVWARLAPLALVAFSVVFSAVLLRSELRTVLFPNDAGAHSSVARFAEQRIRAGHNPFDAWYPYLGLGSPLFSQYQSLPHIITGWLSIPFGDATYRWIGFTLLCTLPVTMYAGARLLGIDASEAAAAALVTPMLVNVSGYGIEWGSFVWLGSGMWSMLWAIWLLPIAVGLAWRAVAKGERYALAVFVVGLTCALHFITGYLVLLSIGVFVLARPQRFVERLGRAALVGVGGLTVFSFVFVPALLGLPYQNVDAFQTGTFWIDSYGPSKVLRWLFRGEVFDWSRFPVVSLLVLCGVIACVVTFRRIEAARVLLGLLALSLLLYSGRRVVGPVIDHLPGGNHLFLHRYVIGVHFAGLLLAGVGAVHVVRAVRACARRLPEFPGRDALTVAIVAVLAVVAMAPVVIDRRDYANSNRSFIAGQSVADDTYGRDVTDLIEIARQRNDGRVYAGSSSNWGTQNKVDQVPIYQIPEQLDTDSIGFYLRTDSLSADIEPYFDDTNPAQYDLFNAKYVLLPAGRTPTVPATTIATRGDYTLYEVATSGYLEVVDTTEPVAADNTNMAAVMRPYLSSLALAQHRHPLVAFRGRSTPAPSSSVDAPYTGFPGAVEWTNLSLHDARFAGQVKATRPAWVMLKESYSPRWTATVDGEPVKTQMLAPSYVGVPVPAGTHLVVFTYRPRSSYLALFALGAFVLLGIALVPLFLRRWKQRGKSAATVAG